MTGGQPVDGPLTVPQLTRQVDAEGVRRIVVIADDVAKYPTRRRLRAGRASAAARASSTRCSASCAALPASPCWSTTRPAPPQRGAGASAAPMPAPTRHVFINEAVCEGCGDCSVKSNCLSVVPVSTEFGCKRAIDPFSCNLDLSCLDGCCPRWSRCRLPRPGTASPWTGGRPPKDDGRGRWRLKRAHGQPLGPETLPEPSLPALDEPFSLLIAGAGGTRRRDAGRAGRAWRRIWKARAYGARPDRAVAKGRRGAHACAHRRRTRRPARAAHRPDADLLLGCDLLVAPAPKPCSACSATARAPCSTRPRRSPAN